MSDSSALQIKFPDWAEFLFKPARFKIAHGGRGSGKSWAYARALILEAVKGNARILCTREVQKSIKDSVHRLLSDQIEAMGLGHLFEILDTTIRGPRGSEFLFAGLASHTVESVKSYEGVTHCWIEEAQTISKKSLDILTPTIRRENSEIWITFNPLMDTDPVWQRFVVSPPANAVVKQVNWDQNPWFPQVLDQEREHCRITAPSDYDNVWEGKCRPTVEGAIYAAEMSSIVSEGRITNVPYDPRLKAHAIWDLGWNDSMAIIIVQRGLSDLRIIGHIEERFKTLDWYAAQLKSLPYNWGYDWLPHDGNTRDFKTGKSTAEILKSFGRKTKQTPNIPVESGIKAARMTLPRCYFDRVKTERLIECLKRYRRSIPATTGEPGSPIHDEFSHSSDALRYLGVVAELLTNEDEWRTPVPEFVACDSGMGY